MHLLVVEDDRDTREFIRNGLTQAGHSVDVAADGREGLFAATSQEFDLIVLDRMLPQIDGLTVLRTLRASGSRVPVLLLSAMGEVDQRVGGLRAGADDYLVKPFAFSELEARIEALARRTAPEGPATLLKVGDLELDLMTRGVKRGEVSIELQPREFRLLEYLMRHAGQVVTRTMLLEHVWDYHFDPQTNVIDVHVSRLRAKIDRGFEPPLLHTVRGAGYRLAAEGGAMAPEAPRSLAARLGALLRTSTFQLTLFYTGLFSMSAALLAMFFYWSTIGLLVRETDATLKAEITGLAEQYLEHGLERLVQVIVHRIRNDQSGAMLYLFATRDNQPLAGNLMEWPQIESDVDGWVEFTHHRVDGRDVPARARVYLLGDGLHLLVGRNIEQLRQLKQVFNRALLLGVGLIFVLATGGGLLMSSRLLKRVGAMTAATGDIIAGQLDRRLEIRGSGDEFDELASRVNIMLDRLQALLATVRHVSDNIAHDLRTPLTRLRNRIELAARAAPENLREELEASVDDADQLLATFAALLRIARIESGSYDAEVEVLEVGTLVNDANELYLGFAQDKQLTLLAEVEGHALVRGDRNLLFQAITNLLDNAIKHSPPGGTVKVEVRGEEGRVVIEVRDGGPGIAEHERERVTERFTRLDQSRSLPGSGLGLSLVKAVADLHQGSLSFSDNAPGLCARLSLPEA